MTLEEWTTISGSYTKQNSGNDYRTLLSTGITDYTKSTEENAVTYEIYNEYTVVPEDISCLEQKTKGKKEITLITCTDDGKQRFIVKAKEV